MTRNRFGVGLVALFLMALGSTHARATVLIVDDDGVQCPSAVYTRISDAVTAARDGDTVRVCPGTYAEQLEINKAIRLTGQTGVIVRPTALSAALPSLLGGNDVTAAILVDAPSASLDGLVVDLSGSTLASCAPLLAGVYFRNASGQIRNSTVMDARVPGMSACDSGIGVYIESGKIGEHFGVPIYGHARVQVRDVNVSGCQKGGLAANGIKTSVRVSRGTFTGDPTSGAVSNGIQLAFGARGRLGRPTIQGYTSATLGQTAAGILLYRPAWASIRKAKIDSVETGVFVVGRAFVERSEFTNIASDGVVVFGDNNHVDFNAMDGAGVSGVFIAGNNNGVFGGYLADMPVGLWFYSGFSNGWGSVHFATSVPLHGQGVYGGKRDFTTSAASPFHPGCATATDCDDASACTTDTCDPITHTCINTVDCDDGNACTADACDTTGCTHVFDPAACDDANECTTDTCDPVSGCQHTAVADGTTCTGGTCTGGVCGP
jgi:nitrous oxidase accessory protein NosD